MSKISDNGMIIAASAILVTLALLLLQGCASVPKVAAPLVVKADPATQVISILELSECDKVVYVVITTADGEIHPMNAEQLSKDQLKGIDDLAQALPEGTTGKIDLICVPRQNTSL